MADMTQTELEGQGPEGQLNTQSEREPNSVVTFVYRGENPYMRLLARGLQARGVPIDIHETSVEKYDTYRSKIAKAFYIERNSEEGSNLLREEREYKRKLIEPLVSSSQGIIVTDITTSHIVEEFAQGRNVNAYDALGWARELTEQQIVEKLAPVIEQIRAQGKNPALLTISIADHVGNIKEIDGEERQQLEQVEKKILHDNKLSWGMEPMKLLIAAMIKKNFDIPVIANFNGRKGENILAILKERGLDPENTVFLVDHHMYQFHKEDVQETGLGEIPIVRICPCCLANDSGNNEGADVRLQALGFKLFPVQVDPSDKAVDLLMRMIDGKRAELTSGYRELHESLVGLGEVEPNLIYQTTKDDKPEVIIIPNYDKEEVREKNWPDNSVTVAVGDDKIRVLSVSPRSHRDEQNSEVRINEPMTHYFRPQEDGSVVTEKEIASDLWRPEPGPGGGMVSGKLRDTDEKDPEVKYQALLESLYKRNEANMQKLGQSVTPEQTARYATLSAAFDPKSYKPGEDLAARFNALAQKLSAASNNSNPRG